MSCSRRFAPVAQWIEQRFPNSDSPDDAKARDGSAKQAQNTIAATSETVTDSDEKRSSATLENKGRTLWGETIAVLVRALDKATTSEERREILAELKAWREGRPS